MALTLSRRVGQVLDIGSDVSVTVTSIRRGIVRLAIEAPRQTKILRREAVKDEEQEYREWAERQRYGSDEES